jgi:hypothetical protein
MVTRTPELPRLELPALSHTDHSLLIRIERIGSRDPKEPGESWTRGLVDEYLEFARRRGKALDAWCRESAPPELRHLFEPPPLPPALEAVCEQAVRQLELAQPEDDPRVAKPPTRLINDGGATTMERLTAKDEKPVFNVGDYIVVCEKESQWFEYHGRVVRIERDPRESWVYFVRFGSMEEIWFRAEELAPDEHAPQEREEEEGPEIPPTPSDSGEPSFW